MFEVEETKILNKKSIRKENRLNEEELIVAKAK
jgi:hypothetical protein